MITEAIPIFLWLVLTLIAVHAFNPDWEGEPTCPYPCPDGMPR